MSKGETALKLRDQDLLSLASRSSRSLIMR